MQYNESTKEDMDTVCNLSEGIYERGIRYGERRGEKRGIAMGEKRGEERMVGLMEALHKDRHMMKQIPAQSTIVHIGMNYTRNISCNSCEEICSTCCG